MILNTGSRTDIPAFYSTWFINRIREGSLMARNPYYPKIIHRYTLDPATVDLLVFCTKNPRPLLAHAEEMNAFRQLWYVTLTPYGADIEPNVHDKRGILQSIRELGKQHGSGAVIWRYDPVLINDVYTVEYHMRAFAQIAAALDGAVQRCVVSFIDLYEKTKRNFPEVREVSREDQETLIRSFVESGSRHGMRILTCLESSSLARFGADTAGCMTQELIEEVIGMPLRVPAGRGMTREGCRCLLGNDIGAYNTCAHFCRYCYANFDKAEVLANMKRHDPDSPLLIGRPQADDEIRDVRQESWLDKQIRLDI
ncbi:MAG: DUF1848 domain-containing protein [Solobacterium sp.]|nr:DUF1848 domain-containing protein [Solobacterium sp.]